MDLSFMTYRLRMSANGKSVTRNPCNKDIEMPSRRGILVCASEIIPSNRKALLPIKLVVGVVGRLQLSATK